jgi:hypothetical protein
MIAILVSGTHIRIKSSCLCICVVIVSHPTHPISSSKTRWALGTRHSLRGYCESPLLASFLGHVFRGASSSYGGIPHCISVVVRVLTFLANDPSRFGRPTGFYHWILQLWFF